MEKEESPVKEKKPKPTRHSVTKILRYTFIGLIALSLGYVHYVYVSTLFENDRNFSHLSAMEREISLRTEMGFYYSYYKTVVEERPFIAGMSRLMYDRLVEYPKEVNTFNRFNIAPEVLIGAMYRYLEPWLNTSTYRQCHTVYRGDDVAPVQSCVGIGEPVLFYLEAVWLLAGLLVAALFLSAYSLSNSVLGGLLAVVQYFANHAECTRVQWAPNERENMAAPLLLLQMWLVAAQLRHARTYCRLQVSIFILNCLCLLFWQFSQFIFLTQTAIFFLMEQFRIIDLKALCIFLHSHFCGLHMAVLLLQGNDMLKTSLYASFFLVVSTYCLLFSSFRIKVQTRVDLFVEAWLVFLRILIVITASFYLKHLISDFLEVADDSHIWDILYSKFTSYKSFHTLLYTCSEAFDFLPLSSVVNMTKTCLIPMVLFGVLGSVHSWFSVERRTPVKKEVDDDDSGIENNADSKEKNDMEPEVTDATVRYLRRLRLEPAVVYHVAQLCVFAVLAALVMRLKLLLGTQLCVVCALAIKANHKYVKRLRLEPAVVYHVAQLCVFAVLAALVMRLKLLLGTQLCVVCALAIKANHKYVKRLRLEPAVVYHVAQLCVFAVLAALVMRLKLLLGTQLCVVCALAIKANHKYVKRLRLEPAVVYHVAQLCVFAVLAALVMRLKLLLGTQLCVVCALAIKANHKYVKRLRLEPAVVYHVAQLCVFAVLAALVMRLKLLLGTQLCVVCALAIKANHKYVKRLRLEPAVVYHVAQLCVFAVLAALVMRLKLLLGTQLCVVCALAIKANHKYMKRLRLEPAVVYHVAQLCVFAVLAALVMRLKLLLGTQLCVVCALAIKANHKYVKRLRLEPAVVYHVAQLCVFAVLAALVMRLKLLLGTQLCVVCALAIKANHKYVKRLRLEPAVVYHVAQLCVFAVLAALVMRLKLLLGTQLCVVCALAIKANHKVPRRLQKYLVLCWVAALAALAQQLGANMADEMAHIGEFSDFQQEELLSWVSRETGAGAAFAGSMPVLATVMLVARRPIVAHPHYETKEARDRSYAVYKVYGKFTTEEIYKELTTLKAIYLIIENKYCYGRSRKGCSFEDIWEAEHPGRRGPRACHLLLTEPAEHFYPVFRNTHYAVFRLHDYSVRYMPRSFDT